MHITNILMKGENKMKDDHFYKKILLIIAFLLACNIVLTLSYNIPDSYAARGDQYLVVDIIDIGYKNRSYLDWELLTESLNEYSKEGWDLFIWSDKFHSLVFKK